MLIWITSHCGRLHDDNLSFDRAKNESNYLLSYDWLDFDGRLEVVGMWHAVGDDSWLECNNGPVVH